MFQITFQPTAYDAPITTVWDLWKFNVSLQAGIVQNGQMVFNCYSSKANVGIPGKVLAQKTYNLTAAEVSAFQAANNLSLGQIAALAYGLAESIQDCSGAGIDATPAQGATGVSFFSGATTV